MEDEIATLRTIANRLADAIYYGTLKEIGGGKISTGLRHDDYDFLRKLANRMEVEKLETRIKELKGKAVCLSCADDES